MQEGVKEGVDFSCLDGRPCLYKEKEPLFERKERQGGNGQVWHWRRGSYNRNAMPTK